MRFSVSMRQSARVTFALSRKPTAAWKRGVSAVTYPVP